MEKSRLMEFLRIRPYKGELAWFFEYQSMPCRLGGIRCARGSNLVGRLSKMPTPQDALECLTSKWPEYVVFGRTVRSLVMGRIMPIGYSEDRLAETIIIDDEYPRNLLDIAEINFVHAFASNVR